MWETPPLSDLKNALEDASNPIGMRMRAAYFLRHLHDNNDDDDYNSDSQQEIVDILARAAKDREMGSLMRHELCYVMGQVRDEKVR
jgi:hypothetical protein